jgi:hypothetical protein
MFVVIEVSHLKCAASIFQVDGSSSTLSMSTHFKMLKKLVEEATFSEILIPLQSVMIPTLPSILGAHANHEPFPGHWAYIAGFDDMVSFLFIYFYIYFVQCVCSHYFY